MVKFQLLGVTDAQDAHACMVIRIVLVVDQSIDTGIHSSPKLATQVTVLGA
ncbi:MAG: hypothetical protein WCJ39_09850 [bacterium]